MSPRTRGHVEGKHLNPRERVAADCKDKPVLGCLQSSPSVVLSNARKLFVASNNNEFFDY